MRAPPVADEVSRASVSGRQMTKAFSLGNCRAPQQESARQQAGEEKLTLPPVHEPSCQ